MTLKSLGTTAVGFLRQERSPQNAPTKSIIQASACRQLS